MAGVTINGFVPKRFSDVLQSMRNNAKPIFQDLVQPGEEVDVGDTSTIGRMIGLVAPDLDELWQAAEQVYQAFDPNSATGVALENVVQYMGITRKVGSPTVSRASTWGESGVFLPQGQVVRNAAGDDFFSTTELTFNENDIIGFAVRPSSLIEGENCEFTIIIDEGIYTFTRTIVAGDTEEDVLADWDAQFTASGITRLNHWNDNGKFYVEVKEYFAYVVIAAQNNVNVVEYKKRLTFNSEEDGDISTPIGTLTTIATPLFGWLSVTNEISVEPGTVYENDEELRERFRVSKAVRASNIAEALYSQLLELPDVDYVRVYENMTNATDIRGLPPHSFMAMVKGGVATDIGEIVWRNKPLGIASYGNQSVTIRDSQNFERVVEFSRPTDVPVYISVEITKTDNNFPENAAEKIREALIAYFTANVGMGENVIYTRLFTPINTVPGHQIDSLTIGRTASPTGMTNLPMDWFEHAITSVERIVITINE